MTSIHLIFVHYLNNNWGVFTYVLVFLNTFLFGIFHPTPQDYIQINILRNLDLRLIYILTGICGTWVVIPTYLVSHSFVSYHFWNLVCSILFTIDIDDIINTLSLFLNPTHVILWQGVYSTNYVDVVWESDEIFLF